MKRCVITMHSQTGAMNAGRILDANGIRYNLIRLPLSYAEKGCTFGLEILCAECDRAMHILSVSDADMGRLVTI